MRPDQITKELGTIAERPVIAWPDDLSDAEFIEWSLRQLNWSNREFAKFVGMHPVTVGDWLNEQQKPKAWVRTFLKLLITTTLILQTIRPETNVGKE